MTVSRRDLLAAAVAAVSLGAGSRPVFALDLKREKLSADTLLAFEPQGQVTLLHLTDLHAQLLPVYFREPTHNLGAGEARGRVPHLTGPDALKAFGLAPGSPEAYALTDQNFVTLARTYGRMGGIDRIATLVKAIRAERGGKVLLLDGGDTFTNSWTALKSSGQDVIDCMAPMRPDAMTGHWDFTLGEARVKAITGSLPFAFLAQNIRDADFGERVFPARKMFEAGGINVAVIGQAFPYTPISNPRWLMPGWTFGLREDDLRREVVSARKAGAGLVVLLSHNGFDVDRKMATRVDGIDVILSGHTHDAVPVVTRAGKSLIVASGSHGKFISRLDLDVGPGGIKGHSYRLIPVFADVIAPDQDTAALIARHRALYLDDLTRVLGTAGGLLYRRGNFAGTLDDVFCEALLSERDAEIALSPGLRWGPSLLPGDAITFEDVTNACAVTYPACYRSQMTGEQVWAALEAIADNLFNPDPYLQQGGDMVRTGGMSFSIAPDAPAGKRISELTLARSGKPIEPAKSYTVAGWASVAEGVGGPPVWDVVARHIERVKTVHPAPTGVVTVRD